jgi:hypothetical protein
MYTKEVGLLREVFNKLNPILDELNSDKEEEEESREIDSKEYQNLLAESDKLVKVNSSHSQHEIYANICRRYQKFKKLFLSIKDLKINFAKEKLVNGLIRYILIFSFDYRN